MSNVINRVPFKMFPLNKNNDNKYSFYSSAPLIVFEFQGTGQRVIKSDTLRLNGYMRIFNKNEGNKLPANRYDVDGTTVPQKNYEQICYPDDRVSVSSCIQTVTISNVNNAQIMEQIREYGRMLSSVLAVSSSYYDLCSTAQNTMASYPNNDCISRVSSGLIPFSIPIRSGFLQSSNVSLPPEQVSKQLYTP